MRTNEPLGLNSIGGLALVLVGIFLAGKKTDEKPAHVEAEKISLRKQ